MRDVDDKARGVIQEVGSRGCGISKTRLVIFKKKDVESLEMVTTDCVIVYKKRSSWSVLS